MASMVELCSQRSLRELKQQLLKALEEDTAEDGDKNDGGELPEGQCRLAALPDLLRRCRVCGLSLAEAGLGSGPDGSRLEKTLLALRSGQAVSPDNEEAALGGLTRWLQWLRSWIPPGSRINIDAALDSLKERRLEASKGGAALRCSKVPDMAERWPPVWICHLIDSHQLLKDATERLMKELNTLRMRTETSQTSQDGNALFAEARRRVAEELVEIAEGTTAITRRRCDGLARRWVRRYAEEAARSLWTAPSYPARRFRQNLREGGICIIEDVLDWSLLLKSHSEAAQVLSEEFRVNCNGQSRWAELMESQLQDAGCQGLATCVTLLHQLQWSLSDHCWGSSKAPGAPGFRRCRWSSSGEVTLWQSIPAKEESPVSSSKFLEDVSDSETSLLAILFLNTPCWRPDWGGALRCHDLERGISRDVWGDGGRMVLLEEATASHELLAASKTQTVSTSVRVDAWTTFFDAC
ncbi:unnamed protein product [Cladocopium goreaui]|uniref:Type II protein arginine methyltransferase n=1 Tax=Cladocopium goreaui TaxID=2562237 RepID=A0A9P1CMX1_9DINO|nr:unnamed protein product [Cladocopium goreaui]